MKGKKDIEERIKELKSDVRYSYPLATIQVNAPLALIQIDLHATVNALEWALKAIGGKED